MALNITKRADNFPKWYQDVIAAGELAEQAPVRGCMTIRPTGFAIWEMMQQQLDTMFKESGHQNAYFPLLIPQSFLEKEAEHVDGFAPEFAMVTHAGGKELEEPLVVRPTSETIIGHAYAKWIKSYRDLPLLLNQWSNVMRWEMRPRLFLRTSEFLWQEGHTVHETSDEAEAETLQMANIYRTFLEEYCAMPVLMGKKPEHEKFPGAERTYTVEAMMQDRKALQAGTSHNLGQNFAKAFDITFLDRNNQQAYGWTTSWGVSTRMIGGLIMTHGDDDGIIIPPKIAPTQAVVIPLGKPTEQAQSIEYASRLTQALQERIGRLRVRMDQRVDMRPADRFFHWIQRGVPIRVEIGPKDIAKNSAKITRRDTRESTFVPLEEVPQTVEALLGDIQAHLFNTAKKLREDNFHSVQTYEELRQIAAKGGGFVCAHWNGSHETAAKVQAETKMSIRLMLDDGQTQESGVCIVSGEPSIGRVVFSAAY